MPRLSVFARAMLSHGIRSRPFYYHYADPQRLFAVDHGPKDGKRRDALVSCLGGETARTRALMSAPLPKPKSQIVEGSVNCSSFLRLTIGPRLHYRGDPVRALAHLEIVISVPVDLDPQDIGRYRAPEPQRVTLTLRLLDVHIQPEYQAEAPQIIDAFSRGISDQVFHHLCDVSLVIDDLIYDRARDVFRFAATRDFVRFQLQCDGHELPRRVALATEARMHAITQGDSVHDRLLDRFDMWNRPLHVGHIEPNDAFAAALNTCTHGRNAVQTVSRERSVPNALHHLFIRTDPVLRVKGDKVVNLAALGAMQTRSAEARAERDMEDCGLTEDEVEWGQSFEDRLEAMKRSTKHCNLSWIFLVDDRTGVYAAFPIPNAQLSVQVLLDTLDSMWRGEHGALRGRPQTVSLPASYTTPQVRNQIAEMLSTRDVGLTKPSSGFATPLHVVRAWYESSRNIKKHDTDGSQQNLPSTMSLAFVRDWAYAHLLSDHARSHYASLGDEFGGGFAFSGGGFGTLTTIQVASYLKAQANVDDLDAFFNQWKMGCKPHFRSDYDLSHPAHHEA